MQVCAVFVPGSSFRIQKRASDFLELKLKIVVSHWVGPENWLWVLESSKSSPQRFQLSPLPFCFVVAVVWIWKLSMCLGSCSDLHRIEVSTVCSTCCVWCFLITGFPRLRTRMIFSSFVFVLFPFQDVYSLGYPQTWYVTRDELLIFCPSSFVLGLWARAICLIFLLPPQCPSTRSWT